MQNRASATTLEYILVYIVTLTFSIVDIQLCWWLLYNRSQPHLFQLLHWYLFSVLL